jgi:hypothetical protein
MCANVSLKRLYARSNAVLTLACRHHAGYASMNQDEVRNLFFEYGIRAVAHKQAQLRKQKQKQLSKKARETRHHW